jgi:hypothetical protein
MAMCIYLPMDDNECRCPDLPCRECELSYNDDDDEGDCENCSE